MMDSARARTVGSSSTSRTVVGVAFSDFIRPSPLALKRQAWGKSEVPTLAVILQFRFHLLHLCSKLRCGSSDRLQIGRSRLSWRFPQYAPSRLFQAPS